MAFRTARYNWASVVNGIRGSCASLTTSPKHLGHSPPAQGIKSKILPKGDFVPVCVAMGMIGLSCSFGVYTALHQLGSSPNVFVKKSRREMVPELVEPEHVAEQGQKFVKHSFFRKVAHIQDFHRHQVMPDPIHDAPKVDKL